MNHRDQEADVSRRTIFVFNFQGYVGKSTLVNITVGSGRVYKRESDFAGML